MTDKNNLTPRMLREVVSEVSERLVQIIEQGRRPSDAEEAFMYASASLNDRIQQIGHVYNVAHREGLSARVLEAEALLGELIYCFRNTITTYDRKLAHRIDVFLRDEVLEPTG